jgi:phosphoribosylformylglycinamidine synthase
VPPPTPEIVIGLLLNSAWPRAIAARERCPFAVIGAIDASGRLTVSDPLFRVLAVDMPLDVLLGKPPRLRRDVQSVAPLKRRFDFKSIGLTEALYRVLRLPAVADKTFLITIGDRTVGGLISRDQLVGRWQVAVSDVGVTAADYEGVAGEALAMGERTPVALLDAPASGRLAVSEAITNILAADIGSLSQIRLSANWMAASGEPGEDAALYATVAAVAKDLCPKLGIAIPVGKDSLSMRTRWNEGGVEKSVVAPVSLIISAFAPVADVRRTLTPALELDERPSSLWLIDLAGGRNRLGASALAQVYGELGEEPADLDEPRRLIELSGALRELREAQLLRAYHDRSDGGLIVTLLEMAFAGHCGLDIALPAARGSAVAQLFSEEPGVVVQILAGDEPALREILARHGLGDAALCLGAPTAALRVQVRIGAALIDAAWADLKRAWSETSWRMRRLRDDPQCADEEFAAHSAEADTGLTVDLAFDPQEDIAAPYVARGVAPKVAILREQGVNSQTETAAVFAQAGFEPHDVHMTDLLGGARTLDEFKGLIACGGFSYGDVLGAGEGWAKSILYHAAVRAQFERFFARADSFALGICNGCQMFAALKSLIPGSGHWPRFVQNRSEQYEARFPLVEVLPSPSVLLEGMAGSLLPIAVSHGEGRAEFPSPQAAAACAASGLVGFRYVHHDRSVADTYPANPSGSPFGIAALSNADGRVTITMPHPERSFRYLQNSWRPRQAGSYSGWMRLFRNARRFVD